jgi:hydrogenase-4 membrane subunit HyfE
MFILIIALIFFLLVLPQPAQAYIDPGTGSYVLQLVIGGFLGGLFIAKNYWQTIKSKITKPKTSDPNHEPKKEIK